MVDSDVLEQTLGRQSVFLVGISLLAFNVHDGVDAVQHQETVFVPVFKMILDRRNFLPLTLS